MFNTSLWSSLNSASRKEAGQKTVLNTSASPHILSIITGVVVERVCLKWRWKCSGTLRCDWCPFLALVPQVAELTQRVSLQPMLPVVLVLFFLIQITSFFHNQWDLLLGKSVPYQWKPSTRREVAKVMGRATSHRKFDVLVAWAIQQRLGVAQNLCYNIDQMLELNLPSLMSVSLLM